MKILNENKPAPALRPSWREAVLRSVFVGGPSLLLAGIAIAAFIHLQQIDRRATENQFHSRAREIAFDIERTYEAYEDQFDSIQRYMNSSETVERREFRAFVSHSLVRLSGIESVHWAPIQTDAANKTIFPIAYTEPETAEKGLDVADLAVSKEIEVSAQKTRFFSRIREAAATPNQASATASRRLIVFTPVFNPGQQQPLPGSDSNELRGFVIGVFNVGKMTETVLSEKEGGDLSVTVTDEAGDDPFLLFHNQSQDQTESPALGALRRDVYTVVGGRLWRLGFKSNANFENNHRSARSCLVLASGLLLSLAFGAFLFVSTQRTETLERLVHQRTIDLQHANGLMKASANELSELNHALTQSNTELQQYAYVASHDLQSPLRAIKAFSQMLKEDCQDSLNEEGSGYIDRIVEGVERMQRMIRDLLDYSRVESHGRPAEIADLNEVAEDAVALLSAAIDDENAAFHIHPMPTIACDRRQIVQLLQNLIGNGIKYRGENDPVVHVSAERGENEWIFEVRDNGIGIDPKNHDHVFDIFRRLHTATEYPGTGIGLAVCRRIVQRHHGRIWLESELGAGCRFFFSIPDQPEADEVVEAADSEPELLVYA